MQINTEQPTHHKETLISPSCKSNSDSIANPIDDTDINNYLPSFLLGNSKTNSNSQPTHKHQDNSHSPIINNDINTFQYKIPKPKYYSSDLITFTSQNTMPYDYNCAFFNNNNQSNSNNNNSNGNSNNTISVNNNYLFFPDNTYQYYTNQTPLYHQHTFNNPEITFIDNNNNDNNSNNNKANINNNSSSHIENNHSYSNYIQNNSSHYYNNNNNNNTSCSSFIPTRRSLSNPSLFHTQSKPFNKHYSNSNSNYTNKHSSTSLNINSKRFYPPYKQPSPIYKHSKHLDKVIEDDFSSLDELIESIDIELPEYITTQNGSRNLQKYLDKITPSEITTLIHLLYNTFPTIMTDLYGNYFSQKLIQTCSQDQRINIIKSIKDSFLSISIDIYGTHSIQTLIEIKNTSIEEQILLSYITNNVFLELSYDINGTHVMQKMISTIKENNREKINTLLFDNISLLLNDANGVCVVKKFINGNTDLTYRHKLLKYMKVHCIEIIQSSYGNYVIQHILDEWGVVYAKDIIDVILDNIVSLSMQKFSSNVVEKFMDVIANEQQRDIKALMFRNLFIKGDVSSLIKNKYGNYVLTKAIKLMNNDDKREIKQCLLKKKDICSNREKNRLSTLIEMF